MAWCQQLRAAQIYLPCLLTIIKEAPITSNVSMYVSIQNLLNYLIVLVNTFAYEHSTKNNQEHSKNNKVKVAKTKLAAHKLQHPQTADWEEY